MGGKKINLLYITHSPIIGGAELSLVSHLKHLNKDEFDVCCIGSYLLEPLVKDIPKVCFIKMDFYLLYRLNPKVIFAYLRMVFKVVRVIEDLDIDIVHTNSVKAHYVGTLAALLTGKKLIWWLRDTTFNPLLYKLLHFIPTKIISVSEYIKNYHLPEDKNIVIFNGSDQYKKNYSIQQLLQLKKELKLEDEFIVGTIERLVRWKGVQNLITAYVSFLQNHPNSLLLIVGSGENQAGSYTNNLKEQVKKLRLEKKVKFLGWRDDADKVLRLFDVLVHPVIEPEPFGLVVVEAMMAKVLVVCSNIGGPKEFIQDGKTGILYKSDDIKKLSEILSSVVEGKIKKDQIVNNAYQFAVQNLSQQAETRKIEQIYYQLITG